MLSITVKFYFHAFHHSFAIVHTSYLAAELIGPRISAAVKPPTVMPSQKQFFNFARL